MEGNTAWMLISTALVLFMVPGLALFYGGMVRSKNVLNMLNMNSTRAVLINIQAVLPSIAVFLLAPSPSGATGENLGTQCFVLVSGD